MPTTVTPRSAHSACRVSSSGISLRQGAHHVAQKLMISDLPAKEPIGVDLPEASWRENSGRVSGILRDGRAPSCGAPSGPAPISLGLGALATPAATRTPG